MSLDDNEFESPALPNEDFVILARAAWLTTVRTSRRPKLLKVDRSDFTIYFIINPAQRPLITR